VSNAINTAYICEDGLLHIGGNEPMSAVTFEPIEMADALKLVGALTVFIIGLYQYVRAQKWKRREFIAQQVKEFEADAEVRMMMKIFDWTDRTFFFPADNGGPPIAAKVTDDLLCAALLSHEDAGAYDLHEVFLRDRIDEFEGEAAFREIDLYAIGALFEAAADIGHGFAHQVRKKSLARVPRNFGGWVEQAQSRCRNHRLLHRQACQSPGRGQISRSVCAVVELTRREARQLPGVAIFKWNDHAVGRHVPNAFKRIGCKARLGLLSFGNHRRTSLLEKPDGVTQRPFLDARELIRCHAAGLHSLAGRNQFRRPRNAPDRFSRYAQQFPHAVSSRSVHPS